MQIETTTTRPRAVQQSWRAQSVALLVCVWLVLQFSGLFSPGLLDDVDSVYIQIAREMLGRHDFVTPTIDGIRFFDKPPLMYWLAAGSMRIFGPYDWAARLPLAMGVLALFLAVYALGLRLYAEVSPSKNPDRAGFYAALATATSIGPYLYTRFFIPDILIALWMTLSVHLFLSARDGARTWAACEKDGLAGSTFYTQPTIFRFGITVPMRQAGLLPALLFGVVLALDVLTKGFIGLVFPLGFVLVFLLVRRELPLLRKLHMLPATILFLLVAAPWHILAALRNPPIAMPTGIGLPSRAGWAWFYLYNEHIARFLGRRVPHDYGQVPVPLFWLLLAIWLLPWSAFLLPALRDAFIQFRTRAVTAASVRTDAALATLLWAGIVLGFFTISSRQEYYHLPALPALALVVGAFLATADRPSDDPGPEDSSFARKRALAWSRSFLVPLGLLVCMVCGYLAGSAHTPPAGADLYATLNNDPAHYNLSLGHLFDLTGTAMGFFRGPLLAVSFGMLVLGPLSHLLRRRHRTYAANLTVAGGMVVVLLAAHAGLARFYPILGSKSLATAIRQDGLPAPVLIDGELTSGSSLLFYLNNPVLLLNGRVNGPWFGSFWPDARPIFLNDADLLRMWHERDSLYLMTYHPEQRVSELCHVGTVVRIASSGGKTVLRNTQESDAKLRGTLLCH